MAKFLLLYLLVTGVSAALVMAMPALVVIGLFMLILPGFVLNLMPSAFFYGVVFAVPWFVASRYLGDGIPATIAGSAAVLLVGFGLPWRTRAADMAAYRDSILPDIALDAPIALQGVVRFELNNPVRQKIRSAKSALGVGETGFACSGYGLAALFTPGVTAVVMASSSETTQSLEDLRTYRLVRRPTDKGNATINFNQVQAPLTNDQLPGTGNFEAGKMLVAQWAMKLSSEYCLVADRTAPAADLTIVERNGGIGKFPGKWSFGAGRVATETVELLAGGQVLFRAHQSTVSTLSRFLFITGSGGIDNFSFGFHRSQVRSKSGYGAVSLPKILGQLTNLAGRPQPAAARSPDLLTDFRAQLSASLDDPALVQGSPGFQMMAAYFELVGDSAGEEDLALIERLLSDRRLTSFPGIYDLRLSLAQAQRAYDAYTWRLIETGVPAVMAKSGARWLVSSQGADSLRIMGFAQRELLADRIKRLAVPELVVSLGYGTSKNAAVLMGILKEHGAVLAEIARQRQDRSIGRYGRQDERDWNIALVMAAKIGLKLLGPQGSAVADELAAYLESGTLPQHLVDGHDMTDWNVVLVRMGRPIESIRKPTNISGTEASYRNNVQMKVDKWKPEWR